MILYPGETAGKTNRSSDFFLR